MVNVFVLLRLYQEIYLQSPQVVSIIARMTIDDNIIS